MADEPNTQAPQTGAQNPQSGQQSPGNAGGTPASVGGSAPDYTAFFAQLDAVLDKRSAGIARSALTDNGVSKEEAHAIVDAYRQHRAGVAQQQAQAAADLLQENQQLRAQLTQGRIEATAMAQAGLLGVDTATIPYLLKLADLSKAVAPNGDIVAEEVSAALTKVLSDLPGLKSQNSGAGFVTVGSDGGNTSPNSDDRMRAWFGLSPKK